VHPSAAGGDLVMTMGNNLGYTFLDYMKIEGVSQASVPTPSESSVLALSSVWQISLALPTLLCLVHLSQ